MCIKCDQYGADHDSPTEPGLSVSDLRFVRKFEPTMDELLFDAPIVSVTYVGRRKSQVLAERREIKFNLALSAVAAVALVAVLVFGF